ncbi:MEKHLA domain-containing protein [Paenibacillus hodogayensis]|uniref:MEKHLA domain-containing protein n=1 Tax=Paenibacillus hodogayensis TaxID=279208 RepID=A0ABV5W3Q0_9BACL
MEDHHRNDNGEEHARLLLDSYRKTTGRELLAVVPDEPLAEQLDEAPFVILSHGTESDPVLNYGNRLALALWETDRDTFTSMPSRLTAEPMLREGRERLLEQVRLHGYSDRYAGVRIALTGRRFRIENATVWNLTDAEGRYAGQAATFSGWTGLDEANHGIIDGKCLHPANERQSPRQKES